MQNFRTRLAYNLPDFRAYARDLYDLLIKPAAAGLQGKTMITVVPDGPLWELPFQALQTSTGKYLLELHAINYAPSLQVLREMRRKADTLRSSPARRKGTDSSSPRHGDHLRQLLALGNPMTGNGTARLMQPFRDSPFDPMPEAETEVRNIAGLWGPNSRVYVGPAALEETFKAEAGKYRIIHLAAHGVFDDNRPLSSYVLLATSNGTKEDGRLEAWELMDMKLQAEIVILSACELGRGDVAAGEGMIGMTWALFVAGVPTTVASQWKVESKNTTKLMKSLHRHLLGDSSGTSTKAEALRQAALEMMRDPQYRSQPFYWAGFVLLGDGL